MSKPVLTPEGPEWSGDVISRVVKAFCAAYDMTRESFALACGIKPRTFYRRLDNGNFHVQEVAKMSAFMSSIGPDKVSIADLYAGHVSVFAELTPHPGGGSPTVGEVAPYLKVVRGEADISSRRSGHLTLLATGS